MDSQQELTNQQLYEDFDPLVWATANVAFGRIKKPPSMSLDDLVQEGRLAVILCYHRWWKPDRGATLKTFITQCLVTTFADIVRQSYRDLQDFQYGISEMRPVYRDPGEAEVSFVEQLLHSLTDLEIRYLSFLLDIHCDGRSLRRRVREELQLDFQTECELRETIRSKIGEC